MRCLFIYLWLACFAFFSIAYAADRRGLKSESAQAEFSSVRLLAGELHKDEAGKTTLDAVLEVKLALGWKTYWRSPGDAGVSLTLELAEDAQNVAGLALYWPYPQRFIEEWGLEVFGFKHDVLLPVRISLTDPDAVTYASFHVNYAVCSDICINEQGKLGISFTPADYKPGKALVRVVKTAWESVPKPNGEGGLSIKSPVIRGEEVDKGVLAVEVHSDTRRFFKPELFIEGAAGLRFPQAKIEMQDDEKHAVFLVPYEISLPAKTLKGTEVTVTLVNGQRSVEGRFTVTEAAGEEGAPIGTFPDSPAPNNPYSDVEVGTDTPLPDANAPLQDPPPPSLFAMILVALVGGLILNVMPCVLPVLSLKLLGVVKHGGKNMREVRTSFLASALGILFFFLILAGVTIAVQQTGMAVGWGFHFQSPWFLGFLIVIITLFALGMFGSFEIRLPAMLNTYLYGAAEVGAIKRHHLLADFVTGLFAALMATPCTAPFLGTAVSFALARGAQEIVVIFTALGVGLAAPYLLAALFPRVATRLPKPGMWMVRVRQGMGVLLLLSVAWLGWVFWEQVSASDAPKPAPVAGEKMTGDVWKAFDEKAIPALLASGKTVFVDVTADWCLTCKYNKFRVLDKPEILALLGAKQVMAMRADMTRPMPDIQAYLKRKGRYGIPFNIVYTPNCPEGKALPELLTVEAVTKALGGVQ